MLDNKSLVSSANYLTDLNSMYSKNISIEKNNIHINGMQHTIEATIGVFDMVTNTDDIINILEATNISSNTDLIAQIQNIASAIDSIIADAIVTNTSGAIGSDIGLNISIQTDTTILKTLNIKVKYGSVVKYDIDSTSDNYIQILTTAGLIDTNLIKNINDVVGEVIPNIDEILLVDDKAAQVSADTLSVTEMKNEVTAIAISVDNNADISSAQASIATQKANEASISESNALSSKDSATASATSATASATSASASATSAATSSSNAATSATSATASSTNATIKASEASASALSASTSASTATTKAGEASASASQALTNRNQAETFAQQAKASALSVDASNIVHRTGDETIAGVKTFSSNIKAPNLDNIAYSVDTIAELKTFTDKSIKSLNVLGYYSKGDGGGGTFYWDSTSTEADNGGTIIQDTGIPTGRWKRVFSGAVNVKWFGAKGDGVTDDTVAIQGALGLKNVEFEDSGNYLISTISALDGSFIQTNMCTFTSDGTANNVINIGSYCVIDALSLTTATQKANTGSMLYGAIKIAGSNNTIGIVNVDKFDFALTIYSGDYNTIEQVIVTNYVRGVLNRDASYTNIRLIDTSIASVNATITPGHNGLLISSGTNIKIGDLYISHAGEHGVRIGGAHTGEDVVKYLDIDNVYIKQVGQCGLKINPNFGQIASYINIGNIDVVDCAYNNATGINEDGVRIQKANKVSIGSINIDKEIKSFSCYDGIFIDATEELYIGSIYVNTPKRDGIHAQDFSADDGVVYSNINNIFINRLTVVNPSNNGVYITSTTQALRNINVENISIVSPLNHGVEVLANSIIIPCSFNGIVISPTNSAYSGVQSADILVDLQSNTFNKSFGIKANSFGRSTLEQKTVSTNGNTVNEVLFIQANGTEVQGNYGGGIAFSGAGASDRRRAAIMARQTGASAPQVGLELWVHNATTSSTSLLDRAFIINHDGSILSNADNLCNIGSASFRWATIYAGTGTINTSDAREKTFLTTTDAETLVAKDLKQLMKKFKFNDAIEAKGDKARIHYGTSAQEVIATFEKYGLNAMEYAMVCYDKWEEQPEELNEEGNVVVEYRPAGDIYGIRYEELLCFIISAM